MSLGAATAGTDPTTVRLVEPSDPTAGVLERARRLGPLPYSALGCNPPPVLPPGRDLVEWLVDAVDAWWVELGRPDPFTLAEVGAGDGTRAADFLGKGPQCLTALRYVLVEDDATLRRQHPTHLPIESPIFVLGPVDADGEDGEGDDELGARPVAGIGPLVTSLAELPVVEGPMVIAAIGWLSRLPSDRLEWRDGAWWEVRLAAGSSETDGLFELVVPVDPPRLAAAAPLMARSSLPNGARLALLGPAAEWIGQTAAAAATEGRLAVIDRWSLVTSLLLSGEVPPLALDQLAAVRRPLQPAPVELFPGLAQVTWRLG
jgi:hypothetical protein